MFYLKRNLPTWERALRVACGAALALAAVWWFPGGLLGASALVGAAVFALTGLVGFCPACAMVGRKA